jgi:DGQHR domain-containing protein
LEYSCFIFKQRTDEESPRFCIFETPVGELLEWSTIPRLTHDKHDGIQREKSDFRVKGITKFLRDEKQNTIPTAIVIALAPGSFTTSTEANGAVKIVLDPTNREQIFVIDGQHRLLGLNEFDPNARVPVVAILDASTLEKAFQFIVINNKAAKVAPDHIRALTFEFSAVELEQRLRTAKLSLSKQVLFVGLVNDVDGSPFKGKLDLPTVPEDNRWVSASAIESCINYIQTKKIISIDDEESLLGFFITIWKFIETNWPNAFNKESKLLSKVGLVTMSKYMVDSIDLMAGLLEDLDLSNEDDVRAACQRVLKMQHMDFWLSSWNITISDSKVVRDQVYDALRRVQQNVKQGLNWYDDVALIKAPWSADD